MSYLQADQMVHIASYSVSNGFVCPVLLLNFANDVMYVSRMKLYSRTGWTCSGATVDLARAMNHHTLLRPWEILRQSVSRALIGK